MRPDTQHPINGAISTAEFQQDPVPKSHGQEAGAQSCHRAAGNSASPREATTELSASPLDERPEK